MTTHTGADRITADTDKLTEDIHESDSEEDPDTLRLNYYKRNDHSRIAKKRKRQTIGVLILLFIVIIVITVMLIVVELNRQEKIKNNNNDNNNHVFLSQCHYDDNIYPIDSKCGIQKCINNYPLRLFALKYGWNTQLIQTRNESIFEMLQYLDENYKIFPNTLEVINDNNNITQKLNMFYKNMSIELSSIHISIEYFCCYDNNEYNKIINLYNNYNWSEFDIYFENFMCLNLTNMNKTINVLLLNEESQSLMANWTDKFEEYLEYNGIDLLSLPRRNGQPFHSTFAIFNQYNQKMESLSVDTLSYLNEKYSNKWKLLPITFSKRNILFI